MPHPSLPATVRRARLDRGLTQAALADKLGFHAAYSYDHITAGSAINWLRLKA